MVTAIIIIFFLLVTAIDFRVIAGSKKKNEIWIYAICLTLSFVILILRSLDIAVPGPSRMIVDALRALSLVE